MNTQWRNKEIYSVCGRWLDKRKENANHYYPIEEILLYRTIAIWFDNNNKKLESSFLFSPQITTFWNSHIGFFSFFLSKVFLKKKKIYFRDFRSLRVTLCCLFELNLTFFIFYSFCYYLCIDMSLNSILLVEMNEVANSKKYTQKKKTQKIEISRPQIASRTLTILREKKNGFSIRKTIGETVTHFDSIFFFFSAPNFWIFKKIAKI
jgi:hypothetical protein